MKMWNNAVAIFCLMIFFPLVEGAAVASPVRSHHHGTPSLALRASVVLTPLGQATAGVAVGYLGYRIAVRSIKKTVEVTTAAILAAAAIRVTGVMDDLPVSPEWSYKFYKLKQEIQRTAYEYGQEIRRHIDDRGLENDVKTFFQRERVVAYSLVGGVLAGVFL